jgi:hypothetical protein
MTMQEIEDATVRRAELLREAGAGTTITWAQMWDDPRLVEAAIISHRVQVALGNLYETVVSRRELRELERRLQELQGAA